MPIPTLNAAPDLLSVFLYLYTLYFVLLPLSCVVAAEFQVMRVRVPAMARRFV